MKSRMFSFAAILAFGGWANLAAGLNTSDFCHSEIDGACLSAIADHVIAAEPDVTKRRRLALRYADVLLPRAPDHAIELVDVYTTDADWRSLRRVAMAFADAGQVAVSSKLIWAAVDARAKNPELRAKVLDMLLMVENAANIGDLNLARRIHSAIVPYLPGELGEYVPLSDELRLTRLMSLYGWPEDAHPVLEAAYLKLRTMPQDSQNYGFTLTRLVTVALLSDHNALHQQLEEDILSLLDVADTRVQRNVQSAHVTALFKAGKIEDAKSRAADYGLGFDATVQNVSHLFLQHESEYFPGIADDTLRRFETMLAAIESPALKAEFLSNLARRMIQDEQFDGMENLLSRVTDPKMRSDLVLQLMTYHARERKDAKTAADLYFSERPKLAPKFQDLGTLLQRYPLSLTARGLLEAGDLERGERIADTVFDLWEDDQSDDRQLDSLLVGTLARVGDDERVKMWYGALDDPSYKLDVLIASLRAQVGAGNFENRSKIMKKIEGVLPQISDAKQQPPKYWPADLPFPTPRGEALDKISQLNSDIVSALAEHDRLVDAREAFAPLTDSERYPWRAHLAIADAVTRVGDVDKAVIEKRMILNKVLDGTVEAREMPYIINAMHP